MGEVAIVGMACLFPGAPDIRTFWRNIVHKVDAISDPPDNWEGEPWYDPDSKAPDRIYMKRAGFLKDICRFDPVKYGIIPKAVNGSEPEHWLSLKIAYEALADAGVPEIPINRERTEVIMGRGTFVNRGYATMCHYSIGMDQALSMLKDVIPELAEEKLALIKEKLKACVPPFGVDTAPGLVTSIMTGRIANRLDLKGSSYAVDAACSSSLLAVEHGYYDLVSRRCDAALVGGINLGTHHPVQLLFCQLGAGSRTQQIRPFDAKADGTLLGDGAGMIVLKRLADAERDGNRIYAVIRGVGSASDGKGASVIAPRAEGEELAIRRAYNEAGFPPETVELIEAHGTGIPLGDATEIQALTRVFGGREGGTPSCALGSIKSMVGHLLPAAGMAGLIKAVLSLYHKTLPPTLHCDHPDPNLKIDETALYINTESRPWIRGRAASPRRAGINAFGFGGSNAHVIVEEYSTTPESDTEDFDDQWETELLILQGDSRETLVTEAERVLRYLDITPAVVLKDLAFTLNSTLRDNTTRLAIVAATPEEFKQKLVHAVARLRDASRSRIKDKSGIYYFDKPLAKEGTVAFLFPGEGSQYVNMLGDLCRHFPEVRYHFDLLGKACVTYPQLSLYRDAIFPPPPFTEKERKAAEARLWEMDTAITAVMTADKALLTLMEQLKIAPQAMVGHSSGELFTLAASGVSELSRGREENIMGYLLLGHLMMERIEREQVIPDAPLVSVGGVQREVITELIEKSSGSIVIAMDNCPNQVVLCCKDPSTLGSSLELLKKQGAICQVLPFSRPYHTSLFEPARKHLNELFDWGSFSAPQVPVYSCLSAGQLPSDSAELRRFGIEQWLNPVRFRETIESMYNDGVRIFLEVGPKAQLTGFVNDILKNKDHLAVASNVQYRSGITQLHHALGLLAAHGISMDLQCLYKRRRPQPVNLDASAAEHVAEAKPEPPLSLAIPLLNFKGLTLEWMTGKRLVAKEFIHAEREGTERPHGAGTAATGTRQPRIAAPGDNGHTAMPVGASPERIVSTAARERSQVMAEYFQTMEQFLDDQEAVFQAYLKQTQPPVARIPETPSIGRSVPLTPNPAAKPASVTKKHVEAAVSIEDILRQVGPLPFSGTILSHTPGAEITAVREVTLANDIFLFDHTFGRDVSVTDKGLYGLPVMPLTMSLEIMAEAAAPLFPGKVFIGMRDIRAYRWITLEEERFLVKTEVKLEEAGAARVRLRKAMDQSGQSAVGLPILEAIVLFADRYPTPPPVAAFPLTGRRPSRIPQEALYGRVMFHGLRFRGVTSVDWWGEEGVEATITTLPTNNLFSSTASPRFLFDPVLLDAAGQLVAFFYNDDMSKGVDLYPFRAKAFHVYGPPLPAGTAVPSRCRTTFIAKNQLSSDIDMIGPDGRYTMRMIGWEDREFLLPPLFNLARFQARDVLLSTAWNEAVSGLDRPGDITCYRMDDYPDQLLHGHHGVWLNVLVHLALSRRERQQWATMTGSEHRRIDWLLSRVAAKDAVRDLLRQKYGVQLCLSDVDIDVDEHGRPIACGSWTKEVKAVPSISLSHKRGIGLALAALGQAGCGIDIEVLEAKKKGIERLVLKPDEQEVAGTLLASSDDEWLLRLWCAKEAVGKSLGRGLLAGPSDLAVCTIDAQTGRVGLTVKGKLAETFPELQGKRLTASTMRDGILIVAASLYGNSEE